MMLIMMAELIAKLMKDIFDLEDLRVVLTNAKNDGLEVLLMMILMNEWSSEEMEGK